MFSIGKNIIEGALNTTGDLAGSVINAGSNIADQISNIGGQKIKGKVILMRSNVLDFTEFHSSLLDNFTELLGGGVSLQLISATQTCNFSFPLISVVILVILRFFFLGIPSNIKQYLICP